MTIAASNAHGANPDHADLTWFTDSSGVTGRIASPTDWQMRRASILTAMQDVMGPLPDRAKLTAPVIQTRQSVVRDNYRRDTITFDSLYDERVPAYLYVPTADHSGRRLPAVLALHQTHPAAKDNNDDTSPGERNFAYATELVRRGFIVIAPDYPSFGEQNDYNFKTSKYSSGTMKAISDNMRCIDLLQARDDVDPQRIAVIGHSLGAHNALFTAAFDTRIAVAVASCGWTPFHNYYGGKSLAGWAQDRYMPAIREMYHNSPDEVPFDLPEVIAAIAPRAVFSNSPTRDSNFDVEGVRLASPRIQAVFDLLNAHEQFQVVHPDCEHSFPPEVRRQAYEFIERSFADQRK